MKRLRNFLEDEQSSISVLIGVIGVWFTTGCLITVALIMPPDKTDPTKAFPFWKAVKIGFLYHD